MESDDTPNTPGGAGSERKPVTLAELVAAIKQLIDDLTARGIIGP